MTKEEIIQKIEKLWIKKEEGSLMNEFWVDAWNTCLSRILRLIIEEWK